MTKFILVFTGGKMPEGEAESKAEMQAWDDWYRKLGDHIIDQGLPFCTSVKNVTSGGRISDGASDCRSSGYSLIQAESLDSAASLVRDCPALKDGARITVYETMEMQEMQRM